MSVLLLVTFSVVVAILPRDGRDSSCGCFGEAGMSPSKSIARNVALTLLAAAVLAGPHSGGGDSGPAFVTAVLVLAALGLVSGSGNKAHEVLVPTPPPVPVEPRYALPSGASGYLTRRRFLVNSAVVAAATGITWGITNVLRPAHAASNCACAPTWGRISWYYCNVTCNNCSQTDPQCTACCSSCHSKDRNKLAWPKLEKPGGSICDNSCYGNCGCKSMPTVKCGTRMYVTRNNTGKTIDNVYARDCHGNPQNVACDNWLADLTKGTFSRLARPKIGTFPGRAGTMTCVCPS